MVACLSVWPHGEQVTYPLCNSDFWDRDSTTMTLSAGYQFTKKKLTHIPLHSGNGDSYMSINNVAFWCKKLTFSQNWEKLSCSQFSTCKTINKKNKMKMFDNRQLEAGNHSLLSAKNKSRSGSLQAEYQSKSDLFTLQLRLDNKVHPPTHTLTLPPICDHILTSQISAGSD